MSTDPASSLERLRRRVMWKMPSGIYLVGAAVGGEANLMTANWVTQVCSEPKLVAVSIEVTALTHRLIEGSGAFSISMLARKDRALARKFAKPAEVDLRAGTLAGLEFWRAKTGSPVPSVGFAYLDCLVDQAHLLGSHSLFVGEVTDWGFQDSSGGSGEDADPLRMEDTRMHYGG